MGNENSSEKDDKAKKAHRQYLAKNLANFPSIPTEVLKNFLAISNSFQQFAEQNQRFVERLAQTSDIYRSLNLGATEDLLRIVSTQNRLIESQQILLSPAFESMTLASQSIAHLLTANTAQISKTLAHNDVIWRSHLMEISRFAVLSQTSLARIPWEQIGNSLAIHNSTRDILQTTFLGFSQSYKRVFETFENNLSGIVSLPPVLSKLPAVELFNGVNVIDAITTDVEDDIQLREELKYATEETKEETTDRLESLLTELNMELLIPLRGARYALYSENPDHVRHFATSLRELFTHVLHSLAPDNEVKKWSAAPEFYEKNRPTRKARLLYICRELNQEPFSEFLEKDIEAVLAFLSLFQKGTHEMASKYTDIQLEIMLVRMESTLRFILEIWKSTS